jgi:hypothetical protein
MAVYRSLADQPEKAAALDRELAKLRRRSGSDLLGLEGAGGGHELLLRGDQHDLA